MRLDTIIRGLQALKERGYEEILFSCDEEGNCIMDYCDLGLEEGNEKRVTLYPWQSHK